MKTMRSSARRAGLLFASLAVSLGAGGCGGKSPTGEIDRVAESIGTVLGQQVAEAVPDGGKILVLLQRGGGAVEDLRNEAYRQGLRSGLGSNLFQLEEAGPDLKEIRPEHQMTVMQAVTQGWPAMAYLGWSQVDPQAVAVVSFIEFPSSINPRSLAKLPPLFVYSTTGSDTLRVLVQAGTVRYAIIPGRATGVELPDQATAAEVVAASYECLPQ